MSTKFTKEDLKTGDIILRRNGDVGIVCLETKSILLPAGYDYLDWANDDLSDHGLINGKGGYDIIAVVDCISQETVSFAPLNTNSVNSFMRDKSFF